MATIGTAIRAKGLNILKSKLDTILSSDQIKELEEEINDHALSQLRYGDADVQAHYQYDETLRKVCLHLNPDMSVRNDYLLEQIRNGKMSLASVVALDPVFLHPKSWNDQKGLVSVQLLDVSTDREPIVSEVTAEEREKAVSQTRDIIKTQRDALTRALQKRKASLASAKSEKKKEYQETLIKDREQALAERKERSRATGKELKTLVAAPKALPRITLAELPDNDDEPAPTVNKPAPTVIKPAPTAAKPAPTVTKPAPAAAKPGMTYYVQIETLLPTYLTDELDRREWTAVTKKPNYHIDLLVTEGKFQWKEKNIPCNMSSRMDTSILTNKIRLHEFLDIYDPELIATTMVLSTMDDITEAFKMIKKDYNGGVWIWRPEGGWSGEGIKIFNMNEPGFEIDKLTSAWNKLNSTRGRDLKRVILSKYEEDPLLLSLPTDKSVRHKFHLRLHLLVVIDQHGRRAALYPTGDLVFSNNPYKSDDYDNTDIHDTHVRKHATGSFPAQFNELAGDESPINADGVWKQVTDILNKVCKLTMDQIHPYSECMNGFEILGCDFMINNEGRVWLVEINAKPGFDDRRDWQKPRSLELFTGLANYGITDGKHPTPTLDTKIIENGKERSVEMIEVYKEKIEIKQLVYAVAPSSDEEHADMNTDILDKILKDRKWYKRGLGLKEVSLAWGEHNVVPTEDSVELWQLFSDQHAQMKNSLNSGKQAVANKSRLYSTLNKLGLAKQHIPYTQPLKNITSVNGNVLFIKDAKACAQKGIHVVTDDDQLNRIKSGISSKKIDNWIASYAVKDPALWYDGEDGYKFHLRVYVLVSVENGIGRVYANTDWWRVLTAKTPYSTDWSDLSRHLTGGSTTKDNYNWFNDDTINHIRKDQKWIKSATESVIKLMGELGQAIAQSAGPYPESTSAYEIFGPDIMLDNDGKAWVIEVNAHPGYSINRPALNDFVSKIMFNWQMNAVVFPYFGEKAKRVRPLWMGKADGAVGVLSPHAALIRGRDLHVVFNGTSWDLYGTAKGSTEPKILGNITKNLTWTWTDQEDAKALNDVVRDMVKVLSKAVRLR